MFAEKFFKLFPPPQFLDTPYAGLAISDDAIHCVEYSRSHGGLLKIGRSGMKALAKGVVEAGEIKDEKSLTDALSLLSKELKIYAVKASLPEEKMYLFKTTVPSTNIKEMRQNIEFKLEENVPLTPPEALFFFDLIPEQAGIKTEDTAEANTVAVSVAPKTLVENYLRVIKNAGMIVLSFEVEAKGLARSLVPRDSAATNLLIHVMQNKTGLYIVCGGVVCFTSTIPWGSSHSGEGSAALKFAELKKSIQQVKSYWQDHGLGTRIERVIFAGKGALTDGLVSECSAGFSGVSEPRVPFELARVWQNAFSMDSYIPPITFEESLSYGVAAGLALPHSQ